MRRVIFAVSAIVLFASVAAGQGFLPGQIRIFSDSSLEKPYFYDKNLSGPRHFYVVHFGTDGAGGARFAVRVGNGFACSYLDETSIFSTWGDALTGITVDYGDCLPASVLVVTFKFYCAGQTADCTLIWTAPDPTAPSGTIEAFDCGGQPYEAASGYVIGNPTQSCLVNPVEMTTWGRVKALYH
jgi:hypothetical protein